MTSKHLDLGLTDEEILDELDIKSNRDWHMPIEGVTFGDVEGYNIRAIAGAATAKAAWGIVEWLTAKWKADCLDEMDKAPALAESLTVAGIPKP